MKVVEFQAWDCTLPLMLYLSCLPTKSDRVLFPCFFLANLFPCRLNNQKGKTSFCHYYNTNFFLEKLTLLNNSIKSKKYIYIYIFTFKEMSNMFKYYNQIEVKSARDLWRGNCLIECRLLFWKQELLYNTQVEVYSFLPKKLEHLLQLHQYRQFEKAVNGPKSCFSVPFQHWLRQDKFCLKRHAELIKKLENHISLNHNKEFNNFFLKLLSFH